MTFKRYKLLDVVLLDWRIKVLKYTNLNTNLRICTLFSQSILFFGRAILDSFCLLCFGRNLNQ